jgi:hypothetical protein
MGIMNRGIVDGQLVQNRALIEGKNTVPFYTIKNLKTNKEKEVLCSFEELQAMLKKNKNLVQGFSIPVIGEQRMGSGKQNKPPEAFRDILRNIKKHHPRSTVNTFD